MKVKIDTVIELDSIGHALNLSTGMLYPIQILESAEESGRYDIENAVPLDEADDLSLISAHDLAIILEYTANAKPKFNLFLWLGKQQNS